MRTLRRTGLAPFVTIAVVLLLAGCLDGGDGAAAGLEGVADGLRPADLFEYACPPGPNESRDGVCTGRIVSPTQSSVEPYLAIHPAEPNVMAIGVNAHQSTGLVDGSAPNLAVRASSMDFYFTEDGGASWRQTSLPYVSVPGANPTPVQLGFTGDPALEFDADGTLHVSALVSSTGLVPAILPTIGVIYTSTSDLGRTWSPAVALDREHNNDRNWITVGPNRTLYVPWQNFGAYVGGPVEYSTASGSEVAWSLDGGTTWHNQRADQIASGCPTVSIVVVHDDAPLFACAGTSDDGTRTGLRIHELDPASGDLILRAEIQSMPCVWPQMTTLADGSLALVGENCEPDGDLRIARSLDGGWNWSAPARVTGASATGVDLTMWFRGDPWGGLHLLATSGYEALEHLVFDPDGFRLVHGEVIRPEAPDGAPPGQSEGLPLVSGGDHYYGLAFTDDGGYMVWTRDYGLEYTRVEPVWEAA